MPARRLIAVLAVALAAAAAAAILLPHSPEGLRALLVAAGPLAPVVTFAAWILLTPAMFPGTVLAAACGMAFGVVGGASLAFAGAVAGGVTAFAIARTAGRARVEALTVRSATFQQVRALLAQRGFAAILAARLAPGVPASALHYAAGVSPVRLRAFTSAIAIGAVVRTVPYAVLGTGLATGSLVTLLVAGASIAVGALAAALLVARIRRPAPLVSR